MRHLLIVSLGPIQDFIAAARRCRDLWFGSWLLSDLSKTVARAIADSVGRDNLIFPSSESDLREESQTSVANKIVTIVPADKHHEDVAEAARSSLMERLRGHAKTVLDRIQGEWLDREMAETQIDDLIEFVWVAAPIDKTYGEARQQAESLLAQRKRTMLWRDVPWAKTEGRKKSSLDGQRESVILDHGFPSRDRNDQLPPEFVQRLKNTFGIKPNERLCGVGLLKRLGERGGEHRFLSTPHLATMPLLQRIAKEEHAVRPEWHKYLAALNKLAEGERIEETAARPHVVLGHYDGMLLLETRLEEWFDHFDEATRKEKVLCAQQALEKFFKNTKLPRPNPYFAVLLADGDNMGKAIAAQDTKEAHQKLSKALDTFAQDARDIVKAEDGEPIYAGGDDVLAFVPLNHVIESAQKLAEDFKTKLKPFTDDNGDSPTLSVGIAICHFIEPMGHALELARKAEKRAKEKRNSLAVFVDKRSGPPTEVVGMWNSGIAEQLKRFVELHRADDIPDGVAFELLELGTLRERAEEKNKEVMGNLVLAETRRILGRKRAQRGQEPVSEKLIEEIMKDPRELALRLIVARVLADAKDIAEGKPANKQTGKGA